MTKLCYILIGMPGAGKSTWMRNQEWIDDTYVASTDDIIENIAAQYGLTYNEAFKDVVGFAERVMWRELEMFAKNGDLIYIDRTNLSAKSRKKYIGFLKPYGYTFKAILFYTPGETEWRRRLESRPGKTIPENVLKNMRYSYEMPLMSEGFDEIINIGEKE